MRSRLLITFQKNKSFCLSKCVAVTTSTALSTTKIIPKNNCTGNPFLLVKMQLKYHNAKYSSKYYFIRT